MWWLILGNDLNGLKYVENNGIYWNSIKNCSYLGRNPLDGLQNDMIVKVDMILLISTNFHLTKISTKIQNEFAVFFPFVCLIFPHVLFRYSFIFERNLMWKYCQRNSCYFNQQLFFCSYFQTQRNVWAYQIAWNISKAHTTLSTAVDGVSEWGRTSARKIIVSISHPIILLTVFFHGFEGHPKLNIIFFFWVLFLRRKWIRRTNLIDWATNSQKVSKYCKCKYRNKYDAFHFAC